MNEEHKEIITVFYKYKIIGESVLNETDINIVELYIKGEYIKELSQEFKMSDLNVYVDIIEILDKKVLNDGIKIIFSVPKTGNIVDDKLSIYYGINKILLFLNEIKKHVEADFELIFKFRLDLPLTIKRCYV